MSWHNKHVQDFLHKVCKELRFKSTHRKVTRELSDHIEDLKYEYTEKGIDEDTAVLKAVEQMGDPETIGRQLNSTYRPRTEWSILLAAAVLVVLGGIVQFLLSGINESSGYMFSYFLLYAPIGVGVLVSMYFIDYSFLVRYSKLVYSVIFIAVLLGFVYANVRHGVYTHVYYGVLAFIPAFAGIIYGFRNKGYLGIILSGLFYAVAAFTCILAPSFSALLVLTVSCLIIMTTAVVKGFFRVSKKAGLVMVYVPVLTAFVMGILYVIFNRSYVFNRLINMVNPGNDPWGYGYIQLLVRDIITAAKPIGAAVLDGFAGNTALDRVLPLWSTDLQLTCIIGRFGYLAGWAIVGVLVLLILRMFISVLKQKNVHGFLVGFSACLAITVQVAFYLLSNFGVIMPIFVTLPIISFGAFGFIINMALIGLLLSVHRRTDLVDERLEDSRTGRPLFTMDSGRLIIDLGIGSKDNSTKKDE